MTLTNDIYSEYLHDQRLYHEYFHRPFRRSRQPDCRACHQHHHHRSPTIRSRWDTIWTANQPPSCSATPSYFLETNSPTVYYLPTNVSYCGTNFPYPTQRGSLPAGITTNTSNGTNTTNYIVNTTNITIMPTTSLTFLTPSAVDGTDFYSTDYQTVTFDDFQMNKDALVNICPRGRA